MESIDSIITAYLEAKATKADAERREKAAREAIEQFAAGRLSFSTDAYAVILSPRKQFRLDTAALYRDFGEAEIKRAYGKESAYSVITAAAIPAEGKQPA